VAVIEITRLRRRPAGPAYDSGGVVGGGGGDGDG